MINKLPSQTIYGSTSFELFFHQKPDCTYFKVFRGLCYPFLRPYNHNKLEARSLPCVFLGYSAQHKGFWCLELASGKIFVSTHVRFDESVFPFLQITYIPSFTSQSINSPTCVPFYVHIPTTIEVPRQLYNFHPHNSHNTPFHTNPTRVSSSESVLTSPYVTSNTFVYSQLPYKPTLTFSPNNTSSLSSTTLPLQFSSLIPSTNFDPYGINLKVVLSLSLPSGLH